ncbi:OLC1v1035226C1 [Oldenlandia corymbosa var. corymbosa]|uniref:Glycosyltransferase n=1 Tax=Oldenlandia corymbosa var. corymbosa TaxID=529605 RepID=A0AAV1CT04_OLDCO|nr:OLC1v1035226C1 [Oldenlandia corymbosa var. corymbosa]
MPASRHIAVLAFPFGTHAAPLLHLIKRIAASAPEDVIFSFFGSSESNKSIFSGGKGDEEFANIEAYEVWDGVPKDHVFKGNPHFEQIGLFINATPGNFEKAMKEAEEETGVKISCLLTDAFLWFSADLAEKHGVPWIPFWTAASCALSAHLYTDDIRRLLSTNEQTVGMIPGFDGLSIKDMPKEVLMDNNQSPLALLIYNMALHLPRATVVVVNSFEEIDPAITLDLKSKLKKFLNVGPLPLMAESSKKTIDSSADHNDECLEWLKKQDDSSVVYISFGSVITPPPHEMVALAEALESWKGPFLWSLRDHARKNLPDGFIDRTTGNGKFVSWAPQKEVLQSGKVGVFVTHCGWNSILESISYGVPLICRPFFGDQVLNSAMVEDKWKIGLRVKDGVFTKDGTVSAIEVILSSEKGKQIRENVQVLKGKAIDAVQVPNGSSVRNFQDLLELVAMS